VSLTSDSSPTSASIAISRSGDAYWLGSTLKKLPPNRTYQVWGQANGRIVSLDLLGSSPDRLATFRVQGGTSRLMVTNEPKDGSSVPTTPILVQGSVPATL
jgi:hypothetical protein